LALKEPENGEIEEVIKVKGCIHALYLPIPQEGDLSKNLKPGLSNGAAVCYLNSILQILIEIQRRFTLIPVNTDFDTNSVGFWIKEASKISVNLINSQEISTLLGIDGRERYIMRDVNEVFMRLMQFDSLNSFKEIFTVLQQTTLKGQPGQLTEIVCLNLQVKESISASIQQYLSPEEVEVEGQKVEKVEQFVATPKIIALNLKRYRRRFGLVQKITDEVKLEELIKIKVGNGSIGYQLFGFIVHDGLSVDTGHYYTIMRISDKWIKFNDEVVGAIPSIEEYFKGEASVYMAFYESE
jgi:ubiquitin C-terminal hydrolase